MQKNIQFVAFGPVPSRRLGQSLGINNIPFKNCTYSCVYCQVGRSRCMASDRKEFYKAEDILREVKTKISRSKTKKTRIDYLTFAPDGETTLDINLGREIEMLRAEGIKIAAITNASLLWKKSVREELSLADWVSVKIDTTDDDLWRKINRPKCSLDLDDILEGIVQFSDEFKGVFATETMLVRGINDDERDLKRTADFIAGLKAEKSYISIPTRPPAEKYVKPPDEQSVNRAYQIFDERSISAEYLIGYEGNSFAFSGDIRNDLLSITSVHPMKEEAVEVFLDKAGSDRGVVEDMLAKKELLKVRYGPHYFYIRKL